MVHIPNIITCEAGLEFFLFLFQNIWVQVPRSTWLLNHNYEPMPEKLRFYLHWVEGYNVFNENRSNEHPEEIWYLFQETENSVPCNLNSHSLSGKAVSSTLLMMTRKPLALAKSPFIYQLLCSNKMEWLEEAQMACLWKDTGSGEKEVWDIFLAHKRKMKSP